MSDIDNQPKINEPSTTNDISINQDDHSAVDSLLDAVLAPEGKETAPETKEDTSDLAEETAQPAKTIEAKKSETAKVEAKPEIKSEEKKPEVKTTPTAKPAAASETKEDYKPVDADKLVEPKGLNPKKQVEWHEMKRSIKHWEAQAKTASTKAAELEAQIAALKTGANKELPKEINDELTELRKLRVEHYTTRDPKWIETHQKPIDDADNALAETLTRLGMKEDQLKSLKEGGLGNVSDEFWQKEVLDRLQGYPVEQQRVIARLAAARDARERFDAAMSQVKGGNTDFLKRRAEELSAEAKTKEESAVREIAETIGENTKDVKWAAEQPIPDDATPEQRAEIEADNKYYKETLLPVFQEAMANRHTPKMQAQMALGLCAYRRISDVTLPKMEAEIAAKTAEIENLNAEIAKFRKVGKVSGDMRRTSAEAKAESKAIEQANRSKMSDEDAIESALAEIEAAH